MGRAAAGLAKVFGGAADGGGGGCGAEVCVGAGWSCAGVAFAGCGLWIGRCRQGRRGGEWAWLVCLGKLSLNCYQFWSVCH